MTGEDGRTGASFGSWEGVVNGDRPLGVSVRDILEDVGDDDNGDDEKGEEDSDSDEYVGDDYNGDDKKGE